MNEILELIRSVFAGMWRYRWGALIVSALVGLCSAVAAIMIPDRYEASARVQVDAQSILKPLMAGLAVQPNIQEQLRMMSRTLISRPNLDRVATLSGADRMTSTAEDRERLIDDLGRRIALNAGGGVNLYTLSFRDTKPELALEIVRAFLTVFVDSNQGEKRRDTEQARKFIDEQLLAYEKRLAGAENALKEFKIRHIGMMPGAAQDYIARASEARLELESARNELRQAEGSRDALRRELALESAFQNPVAQPALQVAPRITETDIRLQDARRRVEDLRIRFTAEHPDVVSAVSMIERFEAQKRLELEADSRRAVPESVASVPGIGTASAYAVIRASLAETEARIAALRARVGSSQAKVAGIERSAQSIPKVETELAQLNRDYEINKQNYEQLLSRRESASLSDSMESTTGLSQFKVIDPPWIPTNPASPNRQLLLAVALLASIVAGIAFAFLRYQIRPSFQSAADLATAFEVPLLGNVTEVSNASRRFSRRLAGVTFSMSLATYLMLFGLAIGFVTLRPAAELAPIRASLSNMLIR